MHSDLKESKPQKRLIESKIGGIFLGITSRVTTKNLKIGPRENFDLEPFLSFFAHFHLFLGWFGTPSSQYKVPLILVRDQRNLLRPFGSPKKWPTMSMEVVPTGITERRPILPFLLLLLHDITEIRLYIALWRSCNLERWWSDIFTFKTILSKNVSLTF